MNEGLPWLRLLMMLGLLTAMFGFPIVVLSVQHRRRRRNEGPGGVPGAFGKRRKDQTS